MRKITLGPFAVFFCLIVAALALSGMPLEALRHLAFGPAERGIGWLLALVLAFYAAAIVICRSYLRVFPLRPGQIDRGSASEFHYHVYLLFYLCLFQPLTRSLLVPVPLMRLLYIALGARLGANTYSAGVILDPPLTSIGSDTIVGHDALIFSHVVEADELSLAPVTIGSGVTIGAKAVVMPGVSIGDGAIIGVGTVLRKHTRVGANEVWIGNPARLKPASPTNPRHEDETSSPLA